MADDDVEIAVPTDDEAPSPEPEVPVAGEGVVEKGYGV